MMTGLGIPNRQLNGEASDQQFPKGYCTILFG